MTPIRITVEGVGGVKLSTDAALDKWLGKKKVKCLIDSDGDEVVDFDSLVDGGEYTLGESDVNEQGILWQQQANGMECFQICFRSFIVEFIQIALGYQLICHPLFWFS